MVLPQPRNYMGPKSSSFCATLLFSSDFFILLQRNHFKSLEVVKNIEAAGFHVLLIKKKLFEKEPRPLVFSIFNNI